jgi:hypothetical protein
MRMASGFFGTPRSTCAVNGLAAHRAADAGAAQVPVAADLVALAVGLDHARSRTASKSRHLGRLLLGLAGLAQLDDHVVLADRNSWPRIWPLMPAERCSARRLT